MKKLTDRQRKALWLVAAVLVASYLFKSAANYARMQAYRRQAYQAWIQAQKKKQEQKKQDNTVGAEAPAALEHLGGIWEGRFSPGRGFCELRLELTEDTPGKYTGYSRFSCMDLSSAFVQPGGDLGRSLNPDTADLSGALEKHAIHFHVDQAIGTDAQGCAITDIVVSRFGHEGINAVWQKGTCGGGHALLARQPR